MTCILSLSVKDEYFIVKVDLFETEIYLFNCCLYQRNCLLNNHDDKNNHEYIIHTIDNMKDHHSRGVTVSIILKLVVICC